MMILVTSQTTHLVGLHESSPKTIVFVSVMPLFQLLSEHHGEVWLGQILPDVWLEELPLGVPKALREADQDDGRVPVPGNPKCDKKFKFLRVSYVTHISTHFLLCRDVTPANLVYSSWTKNPVAHGRPFSPWRFWSQIRNNQTIVALDGII